MSAFECMSRVEQVMHINRIIMSCPDAFPTYWNLRAKIVYRNNEECITLTHSQNVKTKQAWVRFDNMMPCDITPHVT